MIELLKFLEIKTTGNQKKFLRAYSLVCHLGFASRLLSLKLTNLDLCFYPNIPIIGPIYKKEKDAKTVAQLSV